MLGQDNLKDEKLAEGVVLVARQRELLVRTPAAVKVKQLAAALVLAVERLSLRLELELRRKVKARARARGIPRLFVVFI